MTKTEQLNNLFEKWKKDECYVDDFLIGNFVCDGIIDEDEYSKQKIKVLFISNEANMGKNQEYAAECDEPLDRRENFRDYHNKNIEPWGGRLKERVSCLYQVVINDYSKNPHEVANCFAFMNLNKYGGEQQCNIEHLEKYCKVYKDYIKKEIEIIDPDIIIWLACNSFDIGVPEIIGAKHNILTINDRQVPIVRMWHTSYTRIKSNDRLQKFDNIIIDKQAFKLDTELKKIYF